MKKKSKETVERKTEFFINSTNINWKVFPSLKHIFHFSNSDRNFETFCLIFRCFPSFFISFFWIFHRKNNGFNLKFSSSVFLLIFHIFEENQIFQKEIIIYNKREKKSIRMSVILQEDDWKCPGDWKVDPTLTVYVLDTYLICDELGFFPGVCW